MNTAKADALTAREHLAACGWIAPRNESFRHLPPPPAGIWLGDGAEKSPDSCDASPLSGTGWTLYPVGDTLQCSVAARWLDASDPQQRAELFSGLAQPGGSDAAPFAWAHRALCRQGLRLRVGASPSEDPGKTVWLHLRHQSRSTVEAPMLVVDVPDGVHCVLIESHDRDPAQCQHSLTQNLHVHLHLGQGALLQHLRIATPGPGDQVAHMVHVRLGQDAQYAQALVAAGSQYHLQRTVLDLQAPHARARTGAVLLAQAAALEQQVQTVHQAARTESTVEALALASGPAHVVAHAHTRINPGADEACVRQRLHGVPLAGEPRLVLRPHLEIQHDKVQAAHGATWGALPQEALFYACQRGLDETSARALLLEGMATALLERCFDDPDTLATLSADGLLARTIAQQLETHHG
ncbi:MAG: SufD family Fe-S cluster assembly protein [Burkholderiaceae bacterium]